MFVIKKNQVIITALVLMIGTAGYLNFADNRAAQPSQVVLNDDQDITGLVPDVDLYGDQIVSSENKDNKTSTEDNKENNNKEGEQNTQANAENNSNTENVAVAKSEDENAGEAVFVNNSNDTSYFIQAKLEREQARAKQKDILTDVINNSNVAQEKKADAAEEMLKIQERIEKETAAETMIEAKGFKEVYVRIDEDTVDVVVNKTELSESEIAQIEDIIKRKTGATVDKIRISPIKK